MQRCITRSQKPKQGGTGAGIGKKAMVPVTELWSKHMWAVTEEMLQVTSVGVTHKFFDISLFKN